jgi:hypothetical protein
MKTIVKSLIRIAAFSLVLCITAGLASAADGQSEGKLVGRGVKLWGHYCGYCHKAVPGTAYDRLEWKTVMLHMRVRANLPAADSEAILAFLRSSH